MRKHLLLITLLSFLIAGCYTRSSEPESEYDLVVYGTTPAGITAAIQAQRMGRTAVLIGPNAHIGGATTGGLTWTDYGRRETIGGLADEFYVRIKAWYDEPAHWTYEDQESSEVYDRDERYIQSFEPSVALQVFEQMLEEHGVNVMLNEHLQRVQKDGTAIRSITTGSGKTFNGRVFIDASYEGDLMAQAGVRYHVGRESEAQYGENLAGVLGEEERYPQPKKYFGETVDPYDDEGNPLPGIQQVEMGEPGQGDDKIQAYNFRICLSRHPDNRIPITRPADYDPQRYELLARYLDANPPETLQDLLKVSPVPNMKTDINDGSPFSTDYIGANWNYPEGDSTTRAAIFQDHVSFTKGLIYFIGHDARVPEPIREEMLQYGYPKDEFASTDHWSPQLYIREARRMVGAYVMKQQDCQRDTLKATSVGIGSYGVDSHHIQRVIVDGEVINEGNFLAEHHPYEIPYESLLPKREDSTNLLVPVCLSASHVAFGSIRMEPVYMILGQSAAIAAVLSLDEDTDLHDLPYELLRSALVEQNQKLSLLTVSAEQAP